VCLDLVDGSVGVGVPGGMVLRPTERGCRIVPDASSTGFFATVVPYEPTSELDELLRTEGLIVAIEHLPDPEPLDESATGEEPRWARFRVGDRFATVAVRTLAPDLELLISASYAPDDDDAHEAIVAIAAASRFAEGLASPADAMHAEALPFTAREARAFYQDIRVSPPEMADLFVRAAQEGARAEAAAGGGCAAYHAGQLRMDEVIDTHPQITSGPAMSRDEFVAACEATPPPHRDCLSVTHYVTHYLSCEQTRADLSYCLGPPERQPRPRLCESLPDPPATLPVPHPP